jgi:hypothetical protein
MNICRILALMVLVMTSNTSVAAESSDSTIGSNLPPKIRALLGQEMNAVLDATKTILDALVRGQDDVVAQNAQAIHDSFIMKQEMTEADRKALIKSVPNAFLERDRAFHELSANLAEAAQDGDKTRQKQLFTDMVNACTGCHSQHATDRFSEFGNVR